MYSLETPIENLTRVGKTTAGRLKRLGIFTVKDLLSYFPFRYDDFRQLVKINELKPNQVMSVQGKIILINNRKSFKKRLIITEALVEDETGTIRVVWFNQPFLVKNLQPGNVVFLSGKVEFDNFGLQFVSPVYEKSSGQENINTAKIVPVYNLTSNLTQKQIRFLISLACKSLPLLSDWLPREIRDKYDLLVLHQAIKDLHFPADFPKMETARYRLKFDELFLIALQNQLTRQYLATNPAPQIKFQEEEIKKFVSGLAFTLTADQKKAAWQIFLDLEKNKPMNRLIEGDVGSGKTVVAALAILNVVLNGYQAVLMAPTEILAKQHYLTLVKFFQGLPVKIALLTHSQQLISAQEQGLKKGKLLSQVKNGQVNLIIGTQALIQDQVNYQNLGLVIIDEQHRFGVEQRKNLKDKNLHQQAPHFLSMTATPIPRSLALIIYGDLDLSLIKEMPKGRKKIITRVVSEKERADSYQFIRQEINNGRQVFVICPLIDPSDKLGVKSVKEEYDRLVKDIFPDLKIALLHGKLKSQEKEEIMMDFKANRTQILVSTSVIEVGIDIPNATIMMIEGADRFGLAQLHQFRGRVGRGEHQSYCFLFSDNHSPQTQNRLEALVKSNDGFALAEYDLQFRGPGEVYGTKQSGLPELNLATLNDKELINLTKEAASDFLSQNNINDWPEIKAQLNGSKIMDHLE